jgi:hypothetical protein
MVAEVPPSAQGSDDRSVQTTPAKRACPGLEYLPAPTGTDDQGHDEADADGDADDLAPNPAEERETPSPPTGHVTYTINNNRRAELQRAEKIVGPSATAAVGRPRFLPSLSDALGNPASKYHATQFLHVWRGGGHTLPRRRCSCALPRRRWGCRHTILLRLEYMYATRVKGGSGEHRHAMGACSPGHGLCPESGPDPGDRAHRQQRPLARPLREGPGPHRDHRSTIGPGAPRFRRREPQHLPLPPQTGRTLAAL